MVDRNSQAASFNTGNSPSIQQTGIGNARPDTDAYRESRSVQMQSGDTSSTDRVLGTLLNVVGKLGQQKMEQNQAEAMLAGAAHANAGEAENTLETNVLTRNWAVAGYRDTAGRLASAKQQAQIASDMQRMREKSPEEYEAYLAEKRSEVQDSYAGMTLEGRKAMLVQQATNDRANISKHAAEHAKFIIDTETRSLAAGANQQFFNLSAAKVDRKVYNDATDAAMTFAVGSIAMNPKLTPELRSKLVGEYAEQALNSDHQLMFERMQREKVPMPDGTTAPLMSLVDVGTQTKLSGMYRESLKRTEAARNVDYMDGLSEMRSDWANPNSAAPDYDTGMQYLRRGIESGVIQSDERYESLRRELLDAMNKKNNQSTLAAAWSAGDVGTLIKLNKTPTEGLEAYIGSVGKNMTAEQLTSSLIDIGVNTGQEGAFRKAGEIMAPAFVQLGLRDNIDPQQAAALSGFLQRIDQAAKDGKTGAMSQFLSALSPEAAAKVNYMRSNLQARMDPVSAVADAAKRVQDEAAMTPAMRAELSASKAKDINTMVSELTPRGLWGTVGLYAKRLVPFGKTAANANSELALRPYDGWFDNSVVAETINATGKREFMLEAQRVSQMNPGLDPDGVRSSALARVTARTVSTDWGPLIVPPEVTPQRYFGVDVQTPNDRIGSALSEFIKPQNGNRLMFKVGLTGQLQYEEYTDKGERVRTDTIDPKYVGDIVRKQQDNFRKETDAVWGRGVVQGGVNYNGQSTSNADPKWVFDFRQSAMSEGLLRINLTNEATPKQRADATMFFNRDTNTAATYGQRIAITLGKNTQPVFQLFSSIALQDEDFNKSKTYRTMLQAMRANNAEGARAALHESPAYKSVGNKAFFDRMLEDAMKGQ